MRPFRIVVFRDLMLPLSLLKTDESRSCMSLAASSPDLRNAGTAAVDARATRMAMAGRAQAGASTEPGAASASVWRTGGGRAGRRWSVGARGRRAWRGEGDEKEMGWLGPMTHR